MRSADCDGLISVGTNHLWLSILISILNVFCSKRVLAGTIFKPVSARCVPQLRGFTPLASAYMYFPAGAFRLQRRWHVVPAPLKVIT